MKKLILVSFVMLVSMGMMYSQVVHVTSPAAGVTWNKDTAHNITWTSPGCQSGDVKINIFKDSIIQANFVLQLTGPNNGSKNWTVPSNFVDGTYYIRVKTDPAETGCLGDSGAFTIGTSTQPQGSINVATPAPVAPGNNLQINWTSTGTVGSEVRIVLFYQAGNSLGQIIVNNTNNDGNHPWPVPGGIQTGSYRIKVENLAGTISGMSGIFNIGNIITFRPAEAQVYIMPKPDLQISIFFHGDPPNVNEETLMEFRVKNIGKATSSPTKMRAFMASNNTPTWEWDIPSLDPGRFKYKTKNYKPPGVGWILWTANVDQANDSNQKNNRVSKKMIIIGSDLKITNVNTPDYKKTIGQKCTMNVTVTNIGHADSGRFEIDCDMDTCPLIAQGRKFRVHSGLAPGQSATFQFKHRYACFKMVGVKFHVDKSNQVSEENENNNTCGLPFHISGDNIGKGKSPWSSSCSNN